MKDNSNNKKKALLIAAGIAFAVCIIGFIIGRIIGK